MAKKFAFLFQGLGHHKAGMGKELIGFSSRANEIFEIANSIVGYNIKHLCCNGSEEDLIKIEDAQVIMITIVRILVEIYDLKRFRPTAVAGHSAGKFSALEFSGVINFQDSLRIVNKQGEYMAEAARKRPGRMLVVRNIPSGLVEALCNQIKISNPDYILQVANINNPRQIVVSGDNLAIDCVQALCSYYKIKTRELPHIKAGYHSPIMAGVAIEMGKYYKNISFNDFQIPYVSNITGEIVESPGDFQDLLTRWIVGGVQWEKTIQTMMNMGIELYFTFGPVTTMQAVTEAIDPSLKSRVINIYTPEDFERMQKLIDS